MPEKMDGASFYQIFWLIMLPLAGPSIATIAILTFNSSWNNFFGPLIFINSTDKMTLPLGMIFLRNQQGVASSGILMASVVLNLLPVLLIFVLFQRKLVEGITMTGMKGV
jgi:ABC-type glycerol-3-phosphate transport system permease component